MLFLRRRPVASVAPLYVALLALASLSVAMFMMALWPLDAERSPRPAIEGKPAAEGRALEADSRPAPAPQPRSRSVWM